jgi:hypothetical protein
MNYKTHAEYPEFAEDILTILASDIHRGKIAATTLVDELRNRRNSYGLIKRHWRFSASEANYIEDVAEQLGFTIERTYRKKESRNGQRVRIATYICL